MMYERCIDQPPVYVDKQGKVYRYLKDCYQIENGLTNIKPLLYFTYEEYSILQGTEYLTNLIMEL